MLKNRYTLLLGGTALCCLFGSSAMAQQSSGIETVTVTAEKREADLQKVPVAVTALEGGELDSHGIVGFEDLTMQVPSLRFGAGVTGGEHVVTLRGIGSQNTTSGGDSPVAYSVDGVYQGRTTAVDPEFFDISRIEVLHGPQGTLYGRNSVGGSINIITNRPDGEFGAYADAMFGNYSAWTLRGWLNVPLNSGENGPEINARITGVSANRDGYQKNNSTTPGHTSDSDGQDFYLVRGQLDMKFSDDVDFLISGYVTNNDAPVATKLAWGTAPLASQARFVGQTYDPNPRHSSSGFPDRLSQQNNGISGTLTWNLGAATMTSITAYTHGDWHQTNDADSSDLDIAHLNYWTLDSDQFSQEVRFASNPSDSAFSWIAGFFYFNEKVNQGFQYVDTGLNAPFGTGFIFTNGGDIETTSWAPFGQVDLDLSKTSANIPLTVTLGLRYTHDEKKIDDFLNYEIPDFAFVLPLAKVVDKSWSQVTGKFGLAYQASDDTMIYANMSRGYLAGGELVGNFPGVYDPETVMNYETGFKTRFADDRIQLNASAYYTRIRDMQVFVQDITGSRIDNAGKAHVQGVEAELIALPTDALRINASLALTEAKYDEYETIDNRYATPPPSCTLPGGLCDFKGHRLIQTPDWTVGLGAQYTIETEIGTFTPRADVFFSGDLYFLSANSPMDRQDAYTMANLHLSWTSTDGKWTADAFVNNVGDEDVISNDGLQSNTIGLGYGIDNYTYYPPRTYGLRVGVHM